MAKNKITKGEQLILDRLNSVEGPLTSEDLKDLSPHTIREHLIEARYVRASLLERQEKIEETLTGENGLAKQVNWLTKQVAHHDTAIKYLGLLFSGVGIGIICLALKVIFSG